MEEARKHHLNEHDRVDHVIASLNTPEAIMQLRAKLGICVEELSIKKAEALTRASRERYLSGESGL